MHYESSTLGKGYGINFGAKHFGENIYWGLWGNVDKSWG
jgi:hypothetical protein